MKKLAAIVALTAALATPAAAQYIYDPGSGLYVYAQPRGFDEVYTYDSPGYVYYGSPLPLATQRGFMSDPDPNIRSQIQRNYNYYMNLN